MTASDLSWNSRSGRCTISRDARMTQSDGLLFDPLCRCISFCLCEMEEIFFYEHIDRLMIIVSPDADLQS